MGLIRVSKINRKVCPIDQGMALDESAGLLKPLNPAEQFRRYAHFCLENLNEPTLAETEILCRLSDSWPGSILPEHFQRRRNCIMLFHVVIQATQERLFEQLKPFGGSSCFTKSLPQPTGRRSPKCLQFDVSVGKIACRETEKWKSAARFEVDPDDDFFCRRLEAAPKRT